MEFWPVVILACGFCHAGWLTYTLVGWPDNPWDMGVLIINVVYYPLAFLIVRWVVIALRRRKRHDSAIHCEICDYNLTGNESGICPECGTAVEAAA